MNLAPALAVLPQTDVTILVRAAGAWADGRWTPGAESDGATVKCVVQPFPEKKLHLLPEGEQAFGAKLIHDPSGSLKTTNTDDQTAADHVRIGGVRYKIVAAGDWSQMGFGRYIGILEPEV